MLLEQVVEIIEFTDSDHLSNAMESFNEKGIVLDADFPFLPVVFDKAPSQLSARLSRIGFMGQLQIAEFTDQRGVMRHVVFDSNRIPLHEALQWSLAQ
ncbi:hypothetical protein LNL84_11110 [Vibrio sp. ZSDZ34]|uniref:Uncharacterized protein n=1 Tax=Vibrio gelatinilyticus TaxID=2893468 RepID=A0A9X1WDW8_9VIBR|nr:hypothetical protein [Vibrio gelatinilyticus]MCJ2377378.1 hypothetical protein [Vibrio gelatinilyticus]